MDQGKGGNPRKERRGMGKNRSGKNEVRKTIRKECRRGSHSRTSILLKEIERRDEWMRVSKKYETKTKGLIRNGEKEEKVEIETHTKPSMKTEYSIPVVYVPVNPKKRKDGEV